MSWLLPFFLVLNRFHWFNFVQKLVFFRSGANFSSRRDPFRLHLDLVRASNFFCGPLDRFVLCLPLWYQLSF